MSATGAPPAGSDAPPLAPTSTPAMREACPLCAAPLRPDQEWCLSCGAAARTRLAAAPRWRGLVVALAVLVVLSLGVLAAALVELAGGSGAAAPTTTRTVTTTAPASTAVPGDLQRTSTLPPAGRGVPQTAGVTGEGSTHTSG
jgi:hypothetical protein